MLGQIENVKIIIVANEEYIEEKEDYKSFKEKIIDKTYNVTKYSGESINAITNQLLADDSIEEIISNKDFYDTINSILFYHKIKNLRTLKKAILFTKISSKI